MRVGRIVREGNLGAAAANEKFCPWRSDAAAFSPPRLPLQSKDPVLFRARGPWLVSLRLLPEAFTPACCIAAHPHLIRPAPQLCLDLTEMQLLHDAPSPHKELRPRSLLARHLNPPHQDCIVLPIRLISASFRHLTLSSHHTSSGFFS